MDRWLTVLAGVTGTCQGRRRWGPHPAAMLDPLRSCPLLYRPHNVVGSSSLKPMTHNPETGTETYGTHRKPPAPISRGIFSVSVAYIRHRRVAPEIYRTASAYHTHRKSVFRCAGFRRRFAQCTIGLRRGVAGKSCRGDRWSLLRAPSSRLLKPNR